MIFADHYHSNPVVVSFCHLLLGRIVEKRGPPVPSYATFSNNTGNNNRYLKPKHTFL